MLFKRWLALSAALFAAIAVLGTPVLAEETDDDPSLWDKAKEIGGNFVDTVKEKGPGWVDATKDKAGDIYSAAKEKAPEIVDSAKDKISEAGEAFSEFRQEQEGQFWDWFDKQTNGTESVSGNSGAVTSTTDVATLDPFSAPIYYYGADPSATDVAEAESKPETTVEVTTAADLPSLPSQSEPNSGSSIIAFAITALFGIILALAGTMLGLYIGSRRARRTRRPKDR